MSISDEVEFSSGLKTPFKEEEEEVPPVVGTTNGMFFSALLGMRVQIDPYLVDDDEQKNRVGKVLGVQLCDGEFNFLVLWENGEMSTHTASDLRINAVDAARL